MELKLLDWASWCEGLKAGMSGNSGREMGAHSGGTVWLLNFLFYHYHSSLDWGTEKEIGRWLCAGQTSLTAQGGRWQREPPSFTHTQKEAPNNGGCYRGDWSRRRPSFVLLIFFPDQEPKLGFKNRPWTPDSWPPGHIKELPTTFSKQNSTLSLPMFWWMEFCQWDTKPLIYNLK